VSYLGKKLEPVAPAVLCLYRMVVGLLFACHGAAAVLGAFGGARSFGAAGAGRPAAGQWPLWWAGLIELLCGAAVFFGVGDAGTRAAAALSSGAMAYAYFTVHQGHALWPIDNRGELPVLFCWSFLLIAVLGPGAWTLSSVLGGAAPAPRRTGPPRRS
jgi:putative oxidoreductase